MYVTDLFVTGEDASTGLDLLCLIVPSLVASLESQFAALFRLNRIQVALLPERRRRSRRRNKRRVDSLARPSSLADAERRVVKNFDGRRAGDRRAPTEPFALRLGDLPGAPTGAVSLVRRLPRSAEQQRDLDALRVVLRLQSGDAAAFRQLYAMYEPSVRAYVSRLLGPDGDPQDCVQDVFAAAYRHIPRYERRDVPFRSWLFAIARNRTIDELNRHRREVVWEPSTLERALEATQTDGVLDNERPTIPWAQLTEEQRSILVFRYALDLDFGTIAKQLDRSPAAVRQIHSRLLRTLRASSPLSQNV